jgi:hypothetical protein
VVSVTDPYGRILDFLDRSRYFSMKWLLSCTQETAWTPFQTHYFFFSGSAENRTRDSGSVANNSDHESTEAVKKDNSPHRVSNPLPYDL